MKRWRWVGLDVVYAIHDHQLAEHGGLDGIRDEGAIVSALQRPENLARYKRPDVASLAASYAYGLARSHGFSDGNKRTTWVVARLFLLDNKFTIKFDPIDAVKQMESLAAGTVTEADFAGWIRNRLQSIPRKPR